MLTRNLNHELGSKSMYNYRITIACNWKNLTTTYETICKETLCPFDIFYERAVVAEYELSLTDELLENLGYITVDDITFLGVI
jgi:hypothetical protein